MQSKLNLNGELVDRARQSAANIAKDTQDFIDQHTTVTVERAVCRLLGIDGVNEMDVPMPNVVVDHLMANSILPVGAAWYIGNAMVETGLDPQGVAEAIDRGELDMSKLPAHSDADIRAAINPVVEKTITRINENVRNRNEYLSCFGCAIFQIACGRAAQRCSASFSRRSFASSSSLSNSRIRSILALAVSSSFISLRAFR